MSRHDLETILKNCFSAINGEDDVVRDKITVIVYTKRAYDDSALESNMKIVKDVVCTLKEVSKNIEKVEVEEQANKQGVDYNKMHLTAQSLNKGGKVNETTERFKILFSGKFAVSYIVESKPCRDVKTFVTNSKGVSNEVSYFFINCVYSSFII